MSKATFLAGGIAMVIAGHPLDTIKVRLQQQNTKNNLTDAIRKIYSLGGRSPLPFFRGVCIPLVGVIPCCLVGYDAIRFNTFSNVDGIDVIIAGAAAGIAVAPMIAPGERIKCLLQVNQSMGMIELVNSLSSGGVRSLFKGFWATMGREIIGNPVFFFSNWWLRKDNNNNNNIKSPSTATIAFAGGCSGVVQWTLQLPFDTIKTRIQVESPFEMPTGRATTFTARRHYRQIFKQHTYMEIIKDIYYNGGGVKKHARNYEDPYRRIVLGGGLKKRTSGSIFYFWRGWLPSCARAFPASAACFLGVEGAWVAMNKLRLTSDENRNERR